MPVTSISAPANKIKVLSESATRRLTGVYYTPSSAADFMADWIVRHDSEHILEPSFGEGIFLQSVSASNERRGFSRVRLTGVEIDETAVVAYMTLLW